MNGEEVVGSDPTSWLNQRISGVVNRTTGETLSLFVASDGYFWTGNKGTSSPTLATEDLAFEWVERLP